MCCRAGHTTTRTGRLFTRGPCRLPVHFNHKRGSPEPDPAPDPSRGARTRNPRPGTGSTASLREGGQTARYRRRSRPSPPGLPLTAPLTPHPPGRLRLLLLTPAPPPRPCPSRLRSRLPRTHRGGGSIARPLRPPRARGSGAYRSRPAVAPRDRLLLLLTARRRRHVRRAGRGRHDRRGLRDQGGVSVWFLLLRGAQT